MAGRSEGGDRGDERGRVVARCPTCASSDPARGVLTAADGYGTRDCPDATFHPRNRRPALYVGPAMYRALKEYDETGAAEREPAREPLDQSEIAPGHHACTVTTDDDGTLCIIARGFTTIRACVDCGVLMRGGPTRCLYCGNRQSAREPPPCDCGTPGGAHGAECSRGAWFRRPYHAAPVDSLQAAAPRADEKLDAGDQIAKARADIQHHLAGRNDAASLRMLSWLDGIERERDELKRRVTELEAELAKERAR